MQRLPKALNLEKQLLLSNLQTLTLTRTIKRARLPIVITATAAEKSQTLALERLKRENLAQEKGTLPKGCSHFHGSGAVTLHKPRARRR